MNQPAKTSHNWSSLFQLIASLLAALFLSGGAVIIAITRAVQLSTHPATSIGLTNLDPTQSFMVAASLAFAGVLLLPSAWYSWRHLTHPEVAPVPQPERRSFGLILTLVIVILVVGSIFLGNWVSKDAKTSWVILPLLNILATALPTLWLVYIGTRGLLPASPKRKWGVFAVGLVFGPFLILFLELLLLVGVGLLVVLWISLDPNLSIQLSDLGFRLQNITPSIDTILNELLPFLMKPGFLFLGFAFLSVLVPLIEETLKPLAVWFLAGQKITPAMGFGYGVISGAGFGLFENLGNASGGGDTWALLVSARVTTLLLHCFTAGLVGWALASAWSQRRYFRLALTFTIAVFIHGLWNGMALLSTVSTLDGVANISISPVVHLLGSVATVGIVVLGILVLVLFIGFNAVLRHSTSADSSSAFVVAPPPADQTAVSGSVSSVGTPLPGSGNELPAPPGVDRSTLEDGSNHQGSGENNLSNTGK